MDVDKCVMSHIHHYSFIQITSTALKIPDAPPGPPSPTPWQPLIFSWPHGFAFSRVSQNGNPTMQPFQNGHCPCVFSPPGDSSARPKLRTSVLDPCSSEQHQDFVRNAGVRVPAQTWRFSVCFSTRAPGVSHALGVREVLM